jgi:sugar lactone lactonase YvrE
VTRARLAAALAASAALVLGASLASGATNDITTVAGTGTGGFSGDNGPATVAQLSTPTGVAPTADGGYLISDQGNSRVRRVSSSGVITTVAGNGTPGFGGDQGFATSAQISAPNGLAATPDGGFIFGDSNNNRVRYVSPTGLINTVAGGGPGGLGDGGPATSAQLAFPIGVAVRPDGSFLIADNDNHRIREVSTSGVITTVAGTGTPGFGGDNGPATSAQINNPAGIVLTADGGYLFTEIEGQRVRRVSPGGTITTVAGDGTAGSGGDGGPATNAQLSSPTAVALVSGGGFVIADSANHRVRQVVPGGTITTLAGTGQAGFGGDGGPAGAAQLNGPVAVALSTAGHILIADAFNNRIRQIEGPPPAPGQPPPPPPPPPDDPVTLDELNAADPPTLGVDVNVGPVGDGPVLVAIRGAAATAGRAGASQKGLTFVPLTEARQIPVGSFLDTKRGTVELFSARGSGSKLQSGRFNDGVFQVLQSRARRARGLTEVRLKGSSFRRCRTGRRGRAGAAQVRRRTIRRLRSNTTGRYRSRGRFSAGTSRGTVWITSDRCDGTLIKVRRGRVSVRDFRRKRTILVRAGKQYLARAPR